MLLFILNYLPTGGHHAKKGFFDICVHFHVQIFDSYLIFFVKLELESM